MERESFGFPSGSTPRHYWQRMLRRGQVLRTLTQDYIFDISRTSYNESTHNLRPRVALPSLPRGPAVLTRPVRSLRPPLAPSSRGQALSPRHAFHLPELSITRRHRGFTRVHPPGLPPRLLTLDGTGPLGLAPRASHPGRQDLHGARQGRGRASSTRPELYARHQHRTSFR